MYEFNDFSRPVQMRLDEVAETTRLSRKQIVEIALIDLLDDEAKFVVCPICDDFLAIKDSLAGEPAAEVFACACCGNSVSYDTEKEQIKKLQKSSTNITKANAETLIQRGL